ALRADLPARVVRNLTLRRHDRAERQTEPGRRAERGAGGLRQPAARNRIREIGEERAAVVVGSHDRRRLREAGLIAGVEVVVVAEQTNAAADDGAVVEE